MSLLTPTDALLELKRRILEPGKWTPYQNQQAHYTRVGCALQHAEFMAHDGLGSEAWHGRGYQALKRVAARHMPYGQGVGNLNDSCGKAEDMAKFIDEAIEVLAKS